MPSCPYNICSNDYADYIISNNIDRSNLNDAKDIVCSDYLDDLFSVIYSLCKTDNLIPYAAIPNLYTLLDTTSMTASGITQTLVQPHMNIRGQGTMIGFIDTGIDYRNPLFQQVNGTTRLMGIWDQTLCNDSEASVETNGYSAVNYGKTFTQEQINEALRSDQPLAIVPSIDEDGHGTFMAGIAAGNQSLDLSFTGAAPDSAIGVVKLKPAKHNLRDFYCIQDTAIAYQENDIMMAVRYLVELAAQYQMPLVIYIGVGTNYGSHEGGSPLGTMLKRKNQLVGITTVLPAGNETGLRHHYEGRFSSSEEFQDVEIRVGNSEKGFLVQLWADSAEAYSVGFVSPLGHVIDRIQIGYEKRKDIAFVMEKSIISVYYGISEWGSGGKYIFIRFEYPTSGIWRIRVYNTKFISGDYDLWLPVQGFISEDTYFINPNPETTITEPANAYDVITVGAYNHYNSSLYIHSSYGYNRLNYVKPDLVAPGVNVYGPGLSPSTLELTFPMIYKTGTSVAAAHVAGAVANLFTWGIVNQNRINMTTATIKTILISGADRENSYVYPNRSRGYGSLNLYQSFLRLME